MKSILYLFSTNKSCFEHGQLIKKGRLIAAVCLLFFWVAVNAQTEVFTGTGDWTEPARWGGTYPGATVPSSGDWAINGTCNTNTNVTVQGVLRQNSNSGFLTIPNGTIVTIDGGEMRMGSGTNGDITIKGSVTVNNGGTIKNTNIYLRPIIVDGGSITINNGSINCTSLIYIDGILTLGASATGSIGGRIAPGTPTSSIGTLTLNNGGGPAFTPTNKVLIDIGPSSNDVINVGTGAANISTATLELSFVNGASSLDFTNGETFLIMTINGGRGGTTFATNNLPAGWSFDYTSDNFVRIKAPLILPIELMDFKVENTGYSNTLSWQTVSELENEGFDIERSGDGNNWETLGFVSGNGTTQSEQSYTYTDERPLSGVNYYRLRQVDFDGKAEYSDIRSVVMGSSTANLEIYPNPVSDGQLNVNFIEELESVAILRIFDANGKLLHQETLDYQRNKTNYGDLPTGVYFMEVTTGKNLWRQRLMIAK